MSKTKVEFVEEIMSYFKPPFCSEGLVVVERRDNIYEEPALNIKIEKRDVTILESGVTGAGTDLT